MEIIEIVIVQFIGHQFGRLYVLEEAEPVPDTDGTMRIAYLCKCNCGNEVIVKKHYLQRKDGEKSCGCVNAENRTKLGLAKRKYDPHISSARQIFSNTYADGNLPFEEFFKLSQLNCHYCNSKPSNSFNKFANRGKFCKTSDYAIQNGNFIYSGLDRKDPLKSHDIDNVVPCCIWCNFSKMDRTEDEFREHIIQQYNHWANKKTK